MTISRRIRVRRKTWVNKHTDERQDVIAIEAGSREVKIPFEVARQVVDQVHDLCDERESELREASRGN